MKNILLALSLFFAFTVKAQTPKVIDSFLGIKFGSTPAEVIAGLKLKGGTLDKDNSSATILAFAGISLGGRPTEYMYVSFIDNKAYQAGFVFKPELEAKTIDFYNDLVNDLAKVYSEGTATKKFSSPYEDGDGHELTAIETGYADYHTYWGFTEAQQPGIIMVSITDKMIVGLTYIDKKLFAIANKKEEEKKKADF